MLTKEFINQCLRYDNGKLFWLARPLSHFKGSRDCKAWNTRYSNKEAGGQAPKRGGDRWTIKLNDTEYYRSNIIYAYHYGWPKGKIDHINRNQLDDRIENLRIATPSQNCANSSLGRNNTSGFKGVTWIKGAKMWRASITKDRKVRCLGMFADPLSAHHAYVAAAKELFGDFANPAKALSLLTPSGEAGKGGEV